MIQYSYTKGACPLTPCISHWHALLSVLKMVLQEQTCKLGHRGKGEERRVTSERAVTVFFSAKDYSQCPLGRCEHGIPAHLQFTL